MTNRQQLILSKRTQSEPDETEEQYAFVRIGNQIVPYRISEVKRMPIKRKERVTIRPLGLRRKTMFKPTRSIDENVFDNFSITNSPTFIESLKQRFKYVFEPLISETTYDEIDRKSVYKPRFGVRRKVVYKPQDFNKFYEDYDYEPDRTQIAVEDFTPKDKDVVSFNPQTTQESYPVFMYSTYGLPDTYIDEFAPEDVIKIKPITEFELDAKPKPLIISQTSLFLLNKLIEEVTK